MIVGVLPAGRRMPSPRLPLFELDAPRAARAWRTLDRWQRGLLAPLWGWMAAQVGLVNAAGRSSSNIVATWRLVVPWMRESAQRSATTPWCASMSRYSAVERAVDHARGSGSLNAVDYLSSRAPA